MDFIFRWPVLCSVWVIGNLLCSIPLLGMAAYPFFVVYLVFSSIKLIDKLVHEDTINIPPYVIILFSVGLLANFHPFIYWGYLIEALTGLEVTKTVHETREGIRFLPFLLSLISFQVINATLCMVPLNKLVDARRLWAIFIISQAPSNLFFGMFLFSLNSASLGFTYGMALFVAPILTIITWWYLLKMSLKMKYDSLHSMAAGE